MRSSRKSPSTDSTSWALASSGPPWATRATAERPLSSPTGAWNTSPGCGTSRGWRWPASFRPRDSGMSPGWRIWNSYHCLFPVSVRRSALRPLPSSRGSKSLLYITVISPSPLTMPRTKRSPRSTVAWLNCILANGTAETKIHASLIPAIAEIESCGGSELGPVVGSLDDGTDYRDHLQKLTYLERIDPSGTAPTLSQFRSRERFPVQYRTVESPGEMIVLLGYLIGESEARKLPRRSSGGDWACRRRRTSRIEVAPFADSQGVV
jgi:hypothetical protein